MRVALVWGAPGWVWPLVALGGVALALVIGSYARSGTSAAVRTGAVSLKLAGIGLLLLCLAEPFVRRVRARPGANQLYVLVDTSRSLALRDGAGEATRGDAVRALLRDDADWATRAGQDFDLRRMAFDARVRPLEDGAELAFEGDESALARALESVARRAAGRPVAGVVLVTDGLATDGFDERFAWEELPPIFPVVIGRAPARDVGVAQVAVSQTNFEESPVTVRASVRATGYDGDELAVELRDEHGELVERQVVTAADDAPLEARFELAADSSGVRFHQVVVVPPDEGEREATRANDARWVAVDRGAGPYRVLYVSGRPNWEFKFLRRALDADPELELVGLLRIARRQPKFGFRDSADRRNTLWDGFEAADAEAAEQYDEPVLMRVGTATEFELREGFPRAAEDLFAYDALVVDDLEAAFFTHDQMALIEDFVGRRGGGVLALGGAESFREGGYEGTALGDLLPVYLDRAEPFRGNDEVTLALTREGWLEPWARLRATEAQERARLEAMPAFKTRNRVGDVKPGGIVLLEARDERGAPHPGLVVQRFGKGRAAALLVGDLWRWDLAREHPERSDLGTAWRQLARWLVADVPRRVELELKARDGSRELSLEVALRDAAFDPVLSAVVRLTVTPPDGEPVELDAVPGASEAGTWTAAYVPRAAGPHRARVAALAADGSELGARELGWVHEPGVGELRRLTPDRALLEDVARRTGGELVEADELESFAAELATREVPITEPELEPLWHRWWVFVLAIACLCGEWGLRRFKGLP